MLIVKLVFDNSIASPMSPEEFVKEYYLTSMAKGDLKDLNVEQSPTPPPTEGEVEKLKRELEIQHVANSALLKKVEEYQDKYNDESELANKFLEEKRTLQAKLARLNLLVDAAKDLCSKSRYFVTSYPAENQDDDILLVTIVKVYDAILQQSLKEEGGR